MAAVQLALGLLSFVLLIFFIEQSSRSKLRFASATRSHSRSLWKARKLFLRLRFVVLRSCVDF
jgi:hypothetical protein